MWIYSLGWEDPLEEEMANHSNILARIIPWTEELLSMGSQSWTQLSMLTHKLDVYPDKSFMSYILCFVFILIQFKILSISLMESLLPHGLFPAVTLFANDPKGERMVQCPHGFLLGFATCVLRIRKFSNLRSLYS